MPRPKKKVAGTSGSERSGTPVREERLSRAPAAGRVALTGKPGQNKAPQRKRGWRDIEAISERARLKKMLADIWHEDIELEDDIFGDLDHLAGYYADCEVQEEVIEIDDEIEEEDEDFEEKEE